VSYRSASVFPPGPPRIGVQPHGGACNLLILLVAVILVELVVLNRGHLRCIARVQHDHEPGHRGSANLLGLLINLVQPLERFHGRFVVRRVTYLDSAMNVACALGIAQYLKLLQIGRSNMWPCECNVQGLLFQSGERCGFASLHSAPHHGVQGDLEPTCDLAWCGSALCGQLLAGWLAGFGARHGGGDRRGLAGLATSYRAAQAFARFMQ